MDNATILSTFETFIDPGTLEQSIELSLANQAKGELETELKLQITQALDISQTSIVGGNYLTPYNLASDILVPLSPIIYVGQMQYKGAPFKDRVRYQNAPQRWFADLKNGLFYLTGTQAQAQTITFPYISKGNDIDASSDTSLTWPEFTHILVPMQMAKMWFAIDQGDKERAWDDRWGAFFEQTKQALIAWDQQWKLADIGGQTPYGYDAPLEKENRVNIDR